MADASKKGGAPNPMADEEGQAGWAPMKLVAVGVGTLLVALTIIIWMGSRFEGCIYMDGSRSGHAIGR
jgi:hypothetical protein